MNLVLSKNTSQVQGYGKQTLAVAQKNIGMTLNDNQLKVFGQSSNAISDLCEYIDYYTNKKHSWLDSLPIIGDKLKDNRYNKMTIESVVDAFAKHIKELSDNIDDTLNYSRSAYSQIKLTKQDVEKQHQELSELITLNKEENHSRFNTLKYKKDSDTISDEELDELWTIEQNLSILEGTNIALQNVIGSLDMKIVLFKTIVDAGIKIQNKAKQCQALPNILQSALDIMKVTNVLQSAANGLDNTESIVKALVSESANSTNTLVDSANRIKPIAMQFNTIISQIKEVKQDCEAILNNSAI